MDGNFRKTLTILLLLTFNRATNIKACKKYGSIQSNEQIIQNVEHWAVAATQNGRATVLFHIKVAFCSHYDHKDEEKWRQVQINTAEV